MTDKPNLTRVWAKTAPGGNVVDPDTVTAGKFTSGWQAEVPPFEYFNFIQKQVTEGLAHINEQGIAVWDEVTTYPVSGLAKGSDGNVYKAIVSQSDNDPVSDNGTNWIDELNSRVISVTSIAAMEAYSAPAGYVFSLNNGGRSGVFDVVAGPAPKSDPQNGIYITLANGNHAARRFLGAYSVLWFGAIADNSTDAATAIQAAIDFVSVGVVYLPSGNYISQSSIVWNQKIITFLGDGIDLTNLTFSGNIDGLQVGTDSLNGGLLTVKNISIKTVTATTSKAAIRFKSDGIVQGSLKVEDVLIRGENTDTHYWSDGIFSKNAVAPTFENVNIYGISNATSTERTSATDSGIFCTADTGAVIYNFEKVFVIDYSTGLSIKATSNPSIEGVRINRCDFVFVGFGIDIDFSGSAGGYKPPQFYITETHSEFIFAAVRLNSVKYANVTNNLFFGAPGEDLATVCVLLQDCENSELSDNSMQSRPANTSLSGIQFSDCSDCSAKNNQGELSGNLIEFTGSTDSCVEIGNKQTGAGGYSTDSSSGVNQGGKLIEADGYEWTSSGVLSQWGESSGTTDANGDLTINYPRQFNTVFVVVPSNGNGGAGTEPAILMSQNNTGFVVRFPGANAVARSCSWTARGK